MPNEQSEYFHVKGTASKVCMAKYQGSLVITHAPHPIPIAASAVNQLSIEDQIGNYPKAVILDT